jgi:thioredoxin-like negative regulator of GroEL
VTGIPTMILFKDGQMVERIVGFMPKPALMKKLEPHLQASEPASAGAAESVETPA